MEEAGPPSKNMVVAVRIRPLSQRELSSGHKQCCSLLSEKIVLISKEQQAKYLRSQKGSVNEYAFDAAFDHNSSQQQVYEVTTKPFMRQLIDGYNVTVFAYGATGAGKTHTMMGNTRFDDASINAEAGIIPNALQDIFRLIELEKVKNEIGTKWSVGVTFIEVYNEQVYDLLQPMGKCLPLREDKERGVVEIAGVAERAVDNPNSVLELLQQGNRYRKTEATMANQVSSRSHAVLQLMIRRKRTTPSGREAVTESKLSLIDLAGSERASATQNRGARLNEGANINKSLLALANCINALSEKSSGKSTSVKFRDSKLTHLLRSSLEGNCSLIMIANINPSDKTFEDSHNTLKYANRAKNIKVDPTVTDQVKESNWVEREMRLREENVALRNMVQELQNQMLMLKNGSESATFPVSSSNEAYISQFQPLSGPSDQSTGEAQEESKGRSRAVKISCSDARLAAPIVPARSNSAFNRRGHNLKPLSPKEKDDQETDLTINLRAADEPKSARKRTKKHAIEEVEKSLFTLGTAFNISKAADEQHELLDTTAVGRAALLPKYSIKISAESDISCPMGSCSSPMLRAESNQRIASLRRSARKKKITEDTPLSDLVTLPKYSLHLAPDSCASPQTKSISEEFRSTTKSARKRPREEMEPPPSSRQRTQTHRSDSTDIAENGLSAILSTDTSMDICHESDETPMSELLDPSLTRASKKRRGSGIPVRHHAVSASTSALPSTRSNKDIEIGPETDVSGDSFLITRGDELVPLYAAKNSKPALLGAAATYYSKKITTGATQIENKGPSMFNKMLKAAVGSGDKARTKLVSTRSRAPLGTVLSNKIQETTCSRRMSGGAGSQL